MKKLLAAICIVLTFASLSSAQTVVKVGYLAALTGDWAAYGQTEVKAAQLAIEEINASGILPGGIKIELVPYDFRSRQEDAVNAVRRMIEQDKVVAIVGANSSGVNIAVAPLVNKAGIPQIGTVSTNPRVTVDENGKVRPYSFRICFTDPYQGKVLAYYAAKKLNLKKAAILYDVSSDYSQGLREFFIQNYKKYGGEIVADLAFRGGVDVDFRAQLTEIAKAKPQVIILPNMGKEMALTIKQARELGMKDVVFMGGDGYADFMWDIAGDTLEGSYWVNHVSPEDPALQPFFEAYRKKYKDECKEFVNGILAYDAMYLLADAIRRAGSADPKAIRDALENTKNLKLLHAVITIDPNTHDPLNKDAVILLCKGRKAVFHDRVRPEEQ